MALSCYHRVEFHQLVVKQLRLGAQTKLTNSSFAITWDSTSIQEISRRLELSLHPFVILELSQSIVCPFRVDLRMFEAQRKMISWKIMTSFQVQKHLQTATARLILRMNFRSPTSYPSPKHVATTSAQGLHSDRCRKCQQSACSDPSWGRRHEPLHAPKMGRRDGSRSSLESQENGYHKYH